MVNISLKLKDNITLNYDRLNVYEGKLIINSSIGIENVSIRVFVFPKVLKKGWNLISLPFDIGIRKAEDLLALLPNCTSKVLIEWNGNNSYRILKGDENINYTKSYFVYSCKNQTWYLEGFERNETKLTIKKGWNFISLPLPIDYNTSRFEFNCSGEVYNFSEAESKGIVSDVFSFNERKEAWNATNSIIPGKGFLLYANESCILSYKR